MKTMPIDQINPTPAELARIRPCTDTLMRYTELIQEGIELPPVTIFHDGRTHWLADGRHRLAARQRLGYQDIQVEVQQGTERDAQLYAFSSNLRHGLVSNTSDRKRVAERLLQDAEWKEFPNRKIAELAGLSHTTIGKIRNGLETVSKSAIPAKPASSKRPESQSNLVTDEPSKRSHKDDSYNPEQDEFESALETIRELSAENDQLRESIALGTLDIPEGEKMDLAAELKELRSRLDIADMERKSIAVSRDTYMNRSAEMADIIKKLQRVLKRKDEEIKGLRLELTATAKKIESLECDLDFERETR